MARVAAKRARVTWAQAFRDLGLRILSTGRFAPLFAFILLFTAILNAHRRCCFLLYDA